MSRRERIATTGAVVLIMLVGAVLMLVDDEDDPVETTDGTTATTTTTTTTESTTTTTTSTTTSGPDTTTEPDLGAARVQLTPVAELSEPIASALHPGTGDLYLAERGGRVFRFSDGETNGPLIDISAETVPTGERGLLDLAFSPDGGRLYLHFTNNEGNTRLDEFGIDDTGAPVDGSRRNVLSLSQPAPNHNGGEVTFGPDDMLYLGLGDGGGAGDPGENGQDPGTLLGSILRLDPSPSGDRGYSIPSDNPFADGGGAGEVWVWGLRNPWRFAFDGETGDLWIGDVGQDSVEEIDFLPPGEQSGANLGWNAFEGTQVFEGDPAGPTVEPVHEYFHESGACSVTGGVVYRGSRIPALRGAYLFADLCLPDVRALSLDRESGTTTAERSLDVSAPRIAHFGEDAAGEVYVFSLEGTVYRLDPA